MSSPADTIVSVDACVLNVSPKTNWYFLRVQTVTGRIGWGEASLNGWEKVMDACLDMRKPALLGCALVEALDGLQVNETIGGGLAANAIISALAQAFCDLLAQEAKLPLWQWLALRSPESTPMRQRSVPVYANINRASIDRSAKGIAEHAGRVKAQGYTAFKIAPFDGLNPALCGTTEGDRLIGAGLERLAALRDVIGPDTRLMADCHWRFSPEAAQALLPELDPLKLYWFECPISESVDYWPQARRLRQAANERGVLIAAAESQVGLRAFQRTFEQKLYDVVMPDVKYCGGPLEMMAIARAADGFGVKCSPHNPTGPVCTLHSLHLAAAAKCSMLELQVNESPLTDELVFGRHPRLQGGELLLPQGPGLGTSVDESCFERHPYQPVPVGLL